MMLLFLWGIFEYSRYVMLLQVVNNAAREGCRYAVMHTNPVVISGVTYGNADTDVTNLVTNCLGGVALTSQSIFGLRLRFAGQQQRRHLAEHAVGTMDHRQDYRQFHLAAADVLAHARLI